jgi:hypothetical protein
MTEENHATKQACEIPTIMVKMDGNSMSFYAGGWLGRAEPRRFIVSSVSTAQPAAGGGDH